ncbi:MAG: glycosyltransferase family 9 protein [Candidatus Omnitrophota bacterium]
MYVLKNRLYKAVVFLFDLIGTVISIPFRLLRGSRPKIIKKILVIRLDHIGDVVLTTPIFRAIKQKYPDSKLAVLVSAAASDLVTSNPFVDEILKYNAPWFRSRKKIVKLKEFFKLVSQMQKEGFDIGIDPRGDLRHILLMWLAGIKYRVGYGITGGGFLLNKEIGYNPRKHQIERNLDILGAIGISAASCETEFSISDADKKFALDFYAKNQLQDNDFVICIHPSPGFLSKKWLPQRWSRLIIKLIEQFNAKIVMVGLKEEKTLSAALKAAPSASLIDATGKTSLSALAALFKRANLFVGVDSGPSHIASSVGTPCVILYSGTNDPRQWAPRGKKVTVIQKDIPCKGCEKIKCPNNICMDLITVDDVMEAIKKLCV